MTVERNSRYMAGGDCLQQHPVQILNDLDEGFERDGTKGSRTTRKSAKVVTMSLGGGAPPPPASASDSLGVRS